MNASKRERLPVGGDAPMNSLELRSFWREADQTLSPARLFPSMAGSPRKVKRDDELFDTGAKRESQGEGDAECRSPQMTVKPAFKLSL
jgi:hypothetical protein